jgi:flagellar hook-basal body complex protein FliE
LTVIPAIPSIPSVGAAESAGAAQLSAVSGATGSGAVDATGSADATSGSFENILGQAIDSLNGTTNNATNLSLEAATGNASVADATVASTEADLDTQLASAVTDKAVTALNTIMDMQA